MTSIFNDRRGFIPTSIFVPQLLDQSLYSQELASLKQVDIPLLDKEKNKKSNTDIKDNNNHNSFELSQVARIAFEELAKKKDDSLTQSMDTSYAMLEKQFYNLIEQSTYDKAQEQYDLILAKKNQQTYIDNRLREQYEQKIEIEYNQEYEKKILAKKRKIAQEKKLKAYALEFLIGLLLGDPDDPSIPRPFLGILTNFHPGFLRLYQLTRKYIQPITAISPVTFRFGHQFHRMHKEVTIKCTIKTHIQKVFAGIYRQWCEQFVRKIIEKRQRGPPEKTPEKNPEKTNDFFCNIL